MDDTTFDYIKPSEGQLNTMARLRAAAVAYSRAIERELPDGPDKTYTLRKLREVAMWANVAVIRHADGSPRIGSDRSPEYPLDHPAPGDLGSVPL